MLIKFTCLIKKNVLHQSVLLLLFKVNKIITLGFYFCLISGKEKCFSFFYLDLK